MQECKFVDSKHAVTCKKLKWETCKRKSVKQLFLVIFFIKQIKHEIYFYWIVVNTKLPKSVLFEIIQCVIYLRLAMIYSSYTLVLSFILILAFLFPSFPIYKNICRDLFSYLCL